MAAESPLAALTYPELRGEMGPHHYGRVLTAFFGVSGVLLVTRGLRQLARMAFLVRSPALVRLREHGLELSQQTLVLGRVTREREIFVPFGGLISVEREARYANLGFYTGLLALVVGTYFGAMLAIDGFRAGAPGVLVWALVLSAAGLIIDFSCSTALDSARGQCRLLIAVADGRRISVGSLDPALVDALLVRIKEAVNPNGASADNDP